jgi:hypothetical protein
MLVGQRHDEAVELVGFQLLAKGGEAVCIGGHGKRAFVWLDAPPAIAVAFRPSASHERER